MNLKAAAIIPAAGSGSRMQASRPKQFLELAGRPLLVHTISAFHLSPAIDEIIVAVPAQWRDETAAMLRRWRVDDKVRVIIGGRRRQDSVKAGLDQLGDTVEVVLVHDGARPLVSQELIGRCLEQAAAHGAAIAAVAVKDTLKRGDASATIVATVERNNVWQAQTPQAARLSLLRQAFAQAGERDVTDEASLLELAGIPVRLVPGAESNIKITRPEDLMMAESILNPAGHFRIGHGFDAHAFQAKRQLILCGVEIPYHLGLSGHSDADVATHALCDAILGALARGDIGKHFPDSAEEFRGIRSIKLLERVCALMRGDGYTIGNIDLTIVCQEPKLASHMPGMRETLAQGCGIAPSQVNIKATTTEGMGYTGRKEGIGCHAVVLLTSTTRGT